MYIVSVIVVMAISAGVVAAGGGSFLSSFVDAPSCAVFIVTLIPVLAAGGLLRDFGFAFKIAAQPKKEYPLLVLKNALCSVSLAIKTVCSVAVFLPATGLIIILLNPPAVAEYIAKNCAVALMPVFYGAIFLYILLPLKALIQKLCNQKLAAGGLED